MPRHAVRLLHAGHAGIAAHELLSETPDPSEAEIREAISGNICRCTGYVQIVRAIQMAAERLRQGGGGR